MMTVFHNSKALLKSIFCAPIGIKIFVPLQQNRKNVLLFEQLSVSEGKQQTHNPTEETAALFLYLIIKRQRCMLPYFPDKLE